MPKITSDAKLKAIAEENDRFLRSLRSTGNVMLSARNAGRAPETFNGRRRADPDFADAWAAAMTYARANLGGKARIVGGRALVTAGGEYMVGPSRAGAPQVRRAKRGSVTKRGEDAFLAALATTANIRMSAESIGVEPRAFYKRRATSPEFARRMQEALTAGYEAVEFGLLSCALRTLAPDGMGADTDVAEPVAPEIRMTLDQAMTLIAQRAKTMAIGERHVRGMSQPAVTAQQASDLLQKKLDMLKVAIERGRM